MTSRLPNANTKMFLLHAFYGLGATISPLVSTEFVKKVQDKVYLYFWVSLGLAGLTVASLVLVFRFRTEDQVVGRRKDPLAVGTAVENQDEKALQPLRAPKGAFREEDIGPEPSGAGTTIEGEVVGTPHDSTRSSSAERKTGPKGSGSKMRRIMGTPSVHFMACYICIYVGVEVTLGGWIVSPHLRYCTQYSADLGDPD